MAEITVRQAINDALAEEMRRDETIIILGCDVAAREGPFGVTKGLLKEFGKKRVIDTPISEPAFTGAALGAAARGLRPIERYCIRIGSRYVWIRSSIWLPRCATCLAER